MPFGWPEEFTYIQQRYNCCARCSYTENIRWSRSEYVVSQSPAPSTKTPWVKPFWSIQIRDKLGEQPCLVHVPPQPKLRSSRGREMGDFPHLPPPPSPPSAYPVSLLRRPYSSAASQLQRGEENESNMRTLSFSLTPAPAFFACFFCPVTLYNKHKGRTYQDTTRREKPRGPWRMPTPTLPAAHALL